MSRIRGSNTEPEVALRKAIWALGLRYRLSSTLPGKPDLVISAYRTVVFVDGCFWHRCPKHAKAPRTNPEFWQRKLAANVARDIFITKELTTQGWFVIRIWEHEVRNHLNRTARRVYGRIISKGNRQS